MQNFSELKIEGDLVRRQDGAAFERGLLASAKMQTDGLGLLKLWGLLLAPLAVGAIGFLLVAFVYHEVGNSWDSLLRTRGFFVGVAVIALAVAWIMLNPRLIRDFWPFRIQVLSGSTWVSLLHGGKEAWMKQTAERLRSLQDASSGDWRLDAQRCEIQPLSGTAIPAAWCETHGEKHAPNVPRYPAVPLLLLALGFFVLYYNHRAPAAIVFGVLLLALAGGIWTNTIGRVLGRETEWREVLGVDEFFAVPERPETARRNVLRFAAFTALAVLYFGAMIAP